MKYHWSEKVQEFRECGAVECPLGGEHYNSPEEGYAARFNTIPDADEKSVFAKISESTVPEYSDVSAFVNLSADNYKKISELVDERVRKSEGMWNSFAHLNAPAKDGGNKKQFADEKRTFSEYRDGTAVLIEALHNSPHYTSDVVEDTSEAVGDLHITTAHDPNTREWLQARQASFGGSDVGIVAVMDFEKGGVENSAFRSIVKIKTEGYSEEDLANRENREDKRGGALYRGNMWEDHIRDQFAEDHKDEFAVLNNKGQFAHPDRPWQQVNFDGLLQKKGENSPSGILEIKTGGAPEYWANGVPLNYRAQTLYYLNATGFKYAIVRVVLNDYETRDYKISADDPVAEGSDITMSDYVSNRIAPLVENLKKIREGEST